MGGRHDHVSRERGLVVVPCLNEADSIGSVLDEIARDAADVDVLVIDDGSDDRTTEVARRRVKVVSLPRTLGIGGAVQTGIRYAARKGYAFCIQIDGDGQHPAAGIRPLIQEWRETGADLVIGSRYLTEKGFQSSRPRRAGMIAISTCIRCLFGACSSDPTSGFRLLGRRAIERFADDYPPDFPEPISIAMALAAGLRVTEVPVAMRARTSGRSSISGLLRPSAYVLRVCASLFLIRLRRRR